MITRDGFKKDDQIYYYDKNGNTCPGVIINVAPFLCRRPFLISVDSPESETPLRKRVSEKNIVLQKECD